MSECFAQPKKSNKIIISKKTDKILSTYDLDENQDDQESQIFGNNVAKSICLISSKNEFVLEIDENYLDELENEKENTNDIIDDIYKSSLKEKILNNNNESDLSLIIKKINIGLYSGNDFESTFDIKMMSAKDEENKKINNINNHNDLDDNNINEKLENLQKSLVFDEKEKNDNINKDNEYQLEYKNKCSKESEESNFEIIECNRLNKISQREKDNFLLFCIDNLNLSILYEKKNSYEIEFSINDFEIRDNLINSTFKRLLGARKNIEKKEGEKNIQFLSIFVDISNSQNELSTNNYSDFNITCELSLTSTQLMIHQNSLLFLLDFFINDTISKKNSDNLELKIYNIGQYHTKKSFVLDSIFNQVVVETFGEEQNELIEDINFFYITNFLFREFDIHITYESNDLGFNFKNIYIPVIPDLRDYTFTFNRITYKGFVTMNEFTNFFVEHFLGQLSKYNIVFDILKSLSWTQPIINIFGDFFDIFISPFQSYRKNQGFMQGLFKGLKKFFFNLLSKNVYAGEKVIRTLTTFIGVTKNNNIGKNSFYEKYILSDKNKKMYDYFYK